MFTGLIEELGQVKCIEVFNDALCLHIQATEILKDLKSGDSIAVNGCCLTATNCFAIYFTCFITQETLRRTHFKTLQVGDYVNLERALRLQDRLGGHLVQGHVDDIGTIIAKQELENDSWLVSIEVSEHLLPYIVLKGSITIDGISLTIAHLQHRSFSLAIIPHTAKNTTLILKKIGDLVNVETDLIAKYLEKKLQPYSTIL